MQTQVVQTNTTVATSVFSHADIVRVLGLAAMMDAGLPRDIPGTVITVTLGAAEADGEFTATVYGVIDHNFVPPVPGSANGVADAGDASLKSPAPTTPVVPAAAGLGGLQIPGATAS